MGVRQDGRHRAVFRRCASLAPAPLPIMFSYKSEKSLCGTGAGLFAPFVGGLASLPWESNIAQAGIAAALSASAAVGMPPETRTLLLKISNLQRLNGFSWYPAGYTVRLTRACSLATHLLIQI